MAASTKQISFNGEIISMANAKADPKAFIKKVKSQFSEKMLELKANETEEKRVKRIFNAMYRKYAVPTDADTQVIVQAVENATATATEITEETEVTTEAENFKPVEVRVMQTSSALAMNSKELAIDVLCRISDIVLHHVYTDESNTFPNDLMQALKDLNDAAKALKAASEI